MFTLFTFTFAKRQIQCNIAHRTHVWKFRTLNHSGSISYSLGGLAGASQCMASDTELSTCNFCGVILYMLQY